jgi:hypothetical protein
MFEISTSHKQRRASAAMSTTPSGSNTKSRRVPVKAVEPIRDSGADPNEIRENDRQYQKRDEQTIPRDRGIVIDLTTE